MNIKIIGIGEVLWDLLPNGSQMGGAPANFAHHARALGAQASVISRIGMDKPGLDILERFKVLGLPSELVQMDNLAPTGTVEVELAGDGIPRFTIHEHVAWDRLLPTDAALKAVSTAAAVCFGSLAQREEPSRSTIHHLLRRSASAALRVFDINLRQKFYSREVIGQSLGLANVLKLNDAELPVLATMFELTGDMETQLAELANQFDLNVIALTRGPQGSLLYQAGRLSDCGARAVRVQDTVGAGDAFTAALVLGLLNRMDLDEINYIANEVARHVCSCEGATPSLPETFCDLFTKSTSRVVHKAALAYSPQTSSIVTK